METNSGQDNPHPQVAVVIGAGEATGGAIAKRFAREGLVVVVTRRHREALEPLMADIREAGGTVHGYGCDARDEAAMVELFDRIEADIGEVALVVFNIGANVRYSITDTTARVYRKVWEMAAFAGFLTGREAARVMLPRRRGTLIFTGATASLRGGVGFSAFAGAKFALRALAQSMARELGPQGIHVAHAVIDGAIDTDFIRDNFPDRYALKDQGGILDPGHVADQYWQLHCQPRDCWTHELDLRPWIETF
ncbi:SDR family oxidoreductase [Marinobacter halodurans]|uniref:SDR family oxidoreductase n=1 Tax=Marinobacter halodurans TaxID=2528979 RepID=A0ABY1ZN77_9GAMM|nr:SDR family oxidoreductase [Marinobacter halodurans]TBW57944.1 SDR family oxidoreductase [Marinobacter halodurans]